MVLSMDACDLGVGLDADVGLVVDLLDQVLRHALCKSGTAYKYDHFGSIAGVEDGGLSGGVTTPNDENTFPRDVNTVQARGSIKDAAAEEFIMAFKLEAMPGNASGQQEDSGADAVAAVEDDAVAAVLRLDLIDIALEEHLDTEAFGLLEGSFGEFVARDAGSKAEVG